MSKAGRINPGPKPGPNTIPDPKPLKDQVLTFSFKYFDGISNSKFSFQHAKDGYAARLVERLKSLSGWTVNQFVGKPCKTVRNHTLAFAETTEPDGFTHISEQLWSGQCWQFSISANEHGRVHGFLVGSTFHVVWVDPAHKLYS